MNRIIQTKYKGYYFRSRMEARWAVFFDALNIQWQYEIEGYELGKYRYLPDFYLPQVYMWAEVKPLPFNLIEYKKAVLLVKETGKSLLMLIGVPDNKPYSAIKHVGDGEGHIALIDHCLTNYHDYPTRENRFYCSPGCYDKPYGDAYWEDTERAADKAKEARFEKYKKYIDYRKYQPEN